ncbi:MAG: carboxylating nicotinate-nucleotide diphosphorylase [Bacteroidia bacterium]|nr:carboxylating nicotinate-nucleotide diphosphorylase [Bacteroidia bacterium]
MKKNNERYIRAFIQNALQEDVGDGDHTSLATVPENVTGKAHLLVKEKGILAGIEIAQKIFMYVDTQLDVTVFIEDGTAISKGDKAFIVKGPVHSILKAERLVLNIMQRMSGIATATHQYADKIKGLKTKIVDTRKTTPGMRFLEKEAVRIGGGENHRMGLYDMILIKDNHIDFAGGIENALSKTRDYLKKIKKDMKIEIEARTLRDVEKIISIGGIHRIMLDNFSIENTAKAIKMIHGKYETESSGGITMETVKSYAECGVDYISIGALTHHIKSLDMSLKAF